jgi:hypothetical protein
MLEDKIKQKVERQVATSTAQYRHAKGMGYDIKTMGLPTYETQEDFDQYQPQAAGSHYEHENEFVAEILKGLLANNVPARPVTVHYADYFQWLDGRENSSSNRSFYVGILVEREERGM